MSGPDAAQRGGQQQEDLTHINHFWTRICQAQGGAQAQGGPQARPFQPADRGFEKAAELQTPIQPSGKLSMIRMFPAVFSFCIFVIYIWPIIATYHLSTDETVRYWVGSYGVAALLLPIIFICVHIVHTKEGAPNKIAIIVCLVVPCVLLLVLADIIYLVSVDKGNALQSTDCDTFTGKRDLQREWQDAMDLYTKCLKDTVAKYPDKLTMTQAYSLYRIYECEEYASALADTTKPNRVWAWSYLQSLEANMGCAGWCSLNRPIWTFKDTRDSCSSAVSDIFKSKVQRVGLQILVYTLAVLLGGSLGLIYYGPILREKGFKW